MAIGSIKAFMHKNRISNGYSYMLQYQAKICLLLLFIEKY